MNYIKTLQAQNEAKDVAIQAAIDGLAAVRSYLQSTKFFPASDCQLSEQQRMDAQMVHVNDILLRIREIESAMEV